VDGNLAERQQAAAEGQKLIDRALDDWQLRQRESGALDLVRAYREQVDGLSQQLLGRAQQSLERGQDAGEVLERFRHDLVNKLLHQPSVRLRQLAAQERLADLALARELLLDEPDDKTDGGE
jgi:glutamyl-tRNA reductase